MLVEAACAPKAVAISGGFEMTSGPPAGHLPIPEQSIGGGPFSGGNKPVRNWRVVAQNSKTGAQTITAHAYCATDIPVPAFRHNQVTATVPHLEALSESSRCSKAQRRMKKGKKTPKRALSGGGFYSPFAPGTAVLPVHTESRIVGRTFVDTVVNGGPPGGSGPLTLQAQAICF